MLNLNSSGGKQIINKSKETHTVTTGKEKQSNVNKIGHVKGERRGLFYKG